MTDIVTPPPHAVIAAVKAEAEQPVTRQQRRAAEREAAKNPRRWARDKR